VFDRCATPARSAQLFTWERLQARNSVTYPYSTIGGLRVFILSCSERRTRQGALVPADYPGVSGPIPNNPVVLITGASSSIWHTSV